MKTTGDNVISIRDFPKPLKDRGIFTGGAIILSIEDFLKDNQDSNKHQDRLRRILGGDKEALTIVAKNTDPKNSSRAKSVAGVVAHYLKK